MNIIPNITNIHALDVKFVDIDTRYTILPNIIAENNTVKMSVILISMGLICLDTYSTPLSKAHCFQ